MCDEDLYGFILGKFTLHKKIKEKQTNFNEE